MGTSNQAIFRASAEVGYREYSRRINGSMRSNGTKYGAALGINFEPWCATFLTWILLKDGIDLRKISSNPYYTPTLRDSMRAKGMQIDKRGARPGDLIFFDFPDKVRRIQHVGILRSNNGGAGLTTIEGNTSGRSQSNGGMVMIRGRNWEHVVSACRPPYTSAWSSPPTPPPVSSHPSDTTKRKFEELARALAFCKLAVVGTGQHTGEAAVKFVQAGLNHAAMRWLDGKAIYVNVDGVWGPATEFAVKAFQGLHGLVADGIVGSATWSLLYP